MGTLLRQLLMEEVGGLPVLFSLFMLPWPNIEAGVLSFFNTGPSGPVALSGQQGKYFWQARSATITD